MFVADTHALVRYLLGKLPPKSNEIFKSCEEGEYAIFVPTVVLAECYFLIKKGKIQLDFGRLIEKIEESDNFIVVPFNFDIVKLLPTTKINELHDQIIVATTKYLKSKLITKDEHIQKSGEVGFIWN